MEPHDTTEHLESLRTAWAGLNHQIDKSRETIASTQELLKQLDTMLVRPDLKPSSRA
jgi:hypothetical protein